MASQKRNALIYFLLAYFFICSHARVLRENNTGQQQEIGQQESNQVELSANFEDNVSSRASSYNRTAQRNASLEALTGVEIDQFGVEIDQLQHSVGLVHAENYYPTYPSYTPTGRVLAYSTYPTYRPSPPSYTPPQNPPRQTQMDAGYADGYNSAYRGPNCVDPYDTKTDYAKGYFSGYYDRWRARYSSGHNYDEGYSDGYSSSYRGNHDLGMNPYAPPDYNIGYEDGYHAKWDINYRV